MLRQINEFLVACMVILLIAGLLTGMVREGYLLGCLIVVALMAFFIPKSWKPMLGAAGTLFAVAVLICVTQRFLTSIYMDSDGQPALALLLLSLLAYVVWKLRRPRPPEKHRVSGAERTPVLPPQESIE